MPHIHTEEGQHDLTASFLIVRFRDGSPETLFHRHRKIHKYMMFGGHVELNETPWESVLHEVVEETGYEHKQLQVLQPPYGITQLDGAKIHPVPVVFSTKEYPGAEKTHHHTDATYALITSEDPAGTPDAEESLDWKWLTLDELNALPDDDVVEAWRQVARHVLTHYVYAWNARPLSMYA